MSNSIIGFVLVLGVIIFVHEFGHLITAKAFGMKVFIFSFGFGKRLLGFKWGDTDCRLSLVPVGGYVKLEGEPDDHLSESTTTDKVALGDGEIVEVQSPNYFLNRPRWQRFIVYLAGPAMNLVLTLALFTALFMIGFGVDAMLTDPPVVGVVDAGSAAADAGLQPGDEIVSIDGKPQSNWEEALINTVLRPGSTLKVGVRRAGETREVSLAPKTDPQSRMGESGLHPLVRIGAVTPGRPADAAGLKYDDGLLEVDGKPVKQFADLPAILSGSKDAPIVLKIYRAGDIQDVRVTPQGGRIGIANKTIAKRFGFVGAMTEAGRETWRQTRQVFQLLKGIVTAQMSIRAGLAGPLGIAKVSGEAVQGGVVPTLQILAMLSLSVGILNLFPLAPLDGGHLAILAAEGAIRRDLSIRVKTWIMNAGAVVVLFLIVATLYSDLSKTALLGKYLP